MSKLLMVTGDRSLAQGKRGAFYNTLEEFSKHWDRIDIICPRVTSNGQTNNFFGNVFAHPSPWPLFFQPLWITRKGRELFKQNKFDLMTVHEYPPFYNGIGSYFLHQRTRVPYVLEVMHIPGYPKAGGFKERFYKLLTATFIDNDAKHARAVRVINQQETSGFIIKAGVPKDKLVFIPAMYIDLDVFRPTGVAKEYDLIFIGRLAQNKGIELFLKAAAKINARALIIGDGPLKKFVQRKVADSKSSVTFFGYAKDSQEVAGLLNRSRLLVMPSYNEGGPRVVAEALACGVPVLATPVGIVPDLAAGGAAQVVGWDADDIAKKAELLLRDMPRYQEMREKGLALAKQFERKAAVKNYADSLKKLIINPQ